MTSLRITSPPSIIFLSLCPVGRSISYSVDDTLVVAIMRYPTGQFILHAHAHRYPETCHDELTQHNSATTGARERARALLASTHGMSMLQVGLLSINAIYTRGRLMIRRVGTAVDTDIPCHSHVASGKRQ